MTPRAFLADGLSLANGASGVAGILLLLAWEDPRARTAACLMVFVAWGFDAFDGLAARGLQRPAAEGAILDSLCDTTSFGVLPAILLTSAWIERANQAPALVGPIIGIAFFACVVLRLRRYTVRAVSDDARRTSFSGLPSPVAAMAVAAALIASDPSSPIPNPQSPIPAWAPFLFAALGAPLMLSRFPYRDLPRLAGALVRARWPLPALVVLAFFAGVPIAVTIFFGAYVASGLLRPPAPS